MLERLHAEFRHALRLVRRGVILPCALGGFGACPSGCPGVTAAPTEPVTASAGGVPTELPAQNATSATGTSALAYTIRGASIEQAVERDAGALHLEVGDTLPIVVTDVRTFPGGNGCIGFARAHLTVVTSSDATTIVTPDSASRLLFVLPATGSLLALSPGTAHVRVRDSTIALPWVADSTLTVTVWPAISRLTPSTTDTSVAAGTRVTLTLAGANAAGAAVPVPASRVQLGGAWNDANPRLARDAALTVVPGPGPALQLQLPTGAAGTSAVYAFTTKSAPPVTVRVRFGP